MTDRPASLLPVPEGYADWLAELKQRIHAAQQRVTQTVNREFVQQAAAQIHRKIEWPGEAIVQAPLAQLSNKLLNNCRPQLPLEAA